MKYMGLCLYMPQKFQTILFCQSWDTCGQILWQTDKFLTQYTCGCVFFLDKICYLTTCHVHKRKIKKKKKNFGVWKKVFGTTVFTLWSWPHWIGLNNLKYYCFLYLIREIKFLKLTESSFKNFPIHYVITIFCSHIFDGLLQICKTAFIPATNFFKFSLYILTSVWVLRTPNAW